MPDIGDTRGSQYDEKNTTDLIKPLCDYDIIHILLKSHSSLVKVLFKFCIKELLTQSPPELRRRYAT